MRAWQTAYSAARGTCQETTRAPRQMTRGPSGSEWYLCHDGGRVDHAAAAEHRHGPVRVEWRRRDEGLARRTCLRANRRPGRNAEPAALSQCRASCATRRCPVFTAFNRRRHPLAPAPASRQQKGRLECRPRVRRSSCARLHRLSPPLGSSGELEGTNLKRFAWRMLAQQRGQRLGGRVSMTRTRASPGWTLPKSSVRPRPVGAPLPLPLTSRLPVRVAGAA
jgi:hypothetical protein